MLIYPEDEEEQVKQALYKQTFNYPRLSIARTNNSKFLMFEGIV